MVSFVFRLFTDQRINREKRLREVNPDVWQALNLLRIRNLNYDMLLRALQIAADEGDGGIRAFCEDYGLDQVDPVRRIDVVRHALKAVEAGP
jgi:hypothetical protein